MMSSNMFSDNQSSNGKRGDSEERMTEDNLSELALKIDMHQNTQGTAQGSHIQ